jgi:hypothetical protein
MPTRSSVAHPCPRIDTDLLRSDHPIAEVVARYGIELQRVGSTLVGRCPFHADAGRPNLTVFPYVLWKRPRAAVRRRMYRVEQVRASPCNRGP